MIVTGNFSDYYGVTMLPNLVAIVDRGMKGRTPEFPRIFNVTSSRRSLESFSMVSGVGRFQPINQAGKVRYDAPVQGFKKQFTHSRFGLALPTSKDMVEDDEWGLINQSHEDLGWSCQETRELDAATTFNNAFDINFPGPDAVALFSASHPLYKAGGLQSNLLTAADIDMFSLQLGLTAYETQKRPSGELIRLPQPKLVVTASNRFVAYALTRSTDDPTTADRSVNPLAGAEDGIPTAMVWHYWSPTSTNGWFLSAPPQKTGLKWLDRKEPYTDNWTDKETEVGVIAMRYKKSHGWVNYIGLIGNAGV